MPFKTRPIRSSPFYERKSTILEDYVKGISREETQKRIADQGPVLKLIDFSKGSDEEEISKSLSDPSLFKGIVDISSEGLPMLDKNGVYAAKIEVPPNAYVDIDIYVDYKVVPLQAYVVAYVPSTVKMQAMFDNSFRTTFVNSLLTEYDGWFGMDMWAEMWIPGTISWSRTQRLKIRFTNTNSVPAYVYIGYISIREIAQITRFFLNVAVINLKLTLNGNTLTLTQGELFLPYNIVDMYYHTILAGDGTNSINVEIKMRTNLGPTTIFTFSRTSSTETAIVTSIRVHYAHVKGWIYTVYWTLSGYGYITRLDVEIIYVPEYVYYPKYVSGSANVGDTEQLIDVLNYDIASAHIQRIHRIDVSTDTNTQTCKLVIDDIDVWDFLVDGQSFTIPYEKVKKVQLRVKANATTTTNVSWRMWYNEATSWLVR